MLLREKSANTTEYPNEKQLNVSCVSNETNRERLNCNVNNFAEGKKIYFLY